MDEQTTVLIVDDDPGGREALEGVLFSQGYNLVFAESGEQAYQMALDTIPDVILLDVMMPAMDGFAVCRILREDALLAEVPILLVTALDDRSSRLKGIEAGADDFISKPFDRIELRARVHTITRLNRFRRLLLERARFVWVIDQAEEGYVILNENGRITYSNISAQRMVYLPGEEHPAEAFRAWVSKFYECVPQENWQEYLQTGDANGPLYLVKPETKLSEATFLQLELLDLPFGNKRTTLIRILDVTQKINREQSLWSFQSMVSHKLRTPLANTRMAIDFLRHKANGYAGEVKELVDIVTSSTRRLETDVQDILAYISPDQTLKRGSFCIDKLQPLAEEVCKDMSVQDYAVQAMYWDAGADTVEIALSREAFELIFRELIENAIKFHPTRSPRVEIKLGPAAGDQFQVAVADDGVHLSPAQLKSVWIPYYQAEKNFSGEVRGMGLGLPSIANQLWEVGGKFRLYNREDQPGIIVEMAIPLLKRVSR